MIRSIVLIALLAVALVAADEHSSWKSNRMTSSFSPSELSRMDHFVKHPAPGQQGPTAILLPCCC
jgi:hypothetical protein